MRERCSLTRPIFLLSLLTGLMLNGCQAGTADGGATGEMSSLSGAATFTETFDEYATGSWAEGSTHGPWLDEFNGYGSTRIVATSSTNHVLDESPARPATASADHSALVHTTTTFGDLDLSVQVRTVAQLRSPPNPWEMGWVLWHFTDDAHFYYVILKPNGWELGKEDPSAPGGQRFLATGSTPTFPAGPWHTVHITQTGGAITVAVDGTKLTSFSDTSAPYLSGSLGLYTEDAHVQFDNVRVTAPGTSTPDLGTTDLATSVDLMHAPDLAQPPVDMAQPPTTVGRSIPAPIYGVTLDDVSNVSGEVASLKALAHMPTARIVFDRQEPASYYAAPAQQLRSVSYLMGQLLDSSDMSSVTTVSAVATRAQQYVSTLGTNIDLWEVGNEVNGDWLATSTQDTMGKIEAMYQAVTAQHMATALTFFYEGEPSEPNNCISTANGGNDMFTWIDQQFALSLPAAQRPAASEALRTGIDYVLISWYPDQCPGESPNWTTVYAKLATIFPNAKLGFGEIGTANPQNGSQLEIDLINQYYPLAKTTSLPAAYVGGYFWWYFAEEMVPATTTLWKTLNQAIQ